MSRTPVLSVLLSLALADRIKVGERQHTEAQARYRSIFENSTEGMFRATPQCGAPSGYSLSHARAPVGSRSTSIRAWLRMSSEEREKLELKKKIVVLKLEHHDLDLSIQRLADDPHVDELALKRMKKRKLQLKDMIAKLQSKLIPDLDA